MARRARKTRISTIKKRSNGGFDVYYYENDVRHTKYFVTREAAEAWCEEFKGSIEAAAVRTRLMKSKDAPVSSDVVTAPLSRAEWINVLWRKFGELDQLRAGDEVIEAAQTMRQIYGAVREDLMAMEHGFGKAEDVTKLSDAVLAKRISDLESRARAAGQDVH